MLEVRLEIDERDARGGICRYRSETPPAPAVLRRPAARAAAPPEDQVGVRVMAASRPGTVERRRAGVAAMDAKGDRNETAPGCAPRLAAGSGGAAEGMVPADPPAPDSEFPGDSGFRIEARSGTTGSVNCARDEVGNPNSIGLPGGTEARPPRPQPHASGALAAMAQLIVTPPCRVSSECRKRETIPEAFRAFPGTRDPCMRRGPPLGQES